MQVFCICKRSFRAALFILLLIAGYAVFKRIKARQAIATQTRLHMDQAIVNNLNNLTTWQQQMHIGIYWPHQGEPNILTICHKISICFYLPILDAQIKTLKFKLYNPQTKLKKNIYEIPEPVQKETINPQQLDCIMLPMVGFNAQGDRLGHGVGFYDRSLAFKLKYPNKPPLLIGIAYELQKINIQAQTWDVPMNFIVTEKTIYHCH